AKQAYDELLGGTRGVTTVASRVATDKEIQDNLKTAIDELRSASRRIQGKEEHKGKAGTLLLAGIALGILFNPITGPETRRFIKEMISSGDEHDRQAGGSNGRTQSS